MTIDLSAMACSLQQNGIKQVAYQEPYLFIGYYKFYLDKPWLECNGDKWFLDDYRSLINVIAYLGLIDRNIALMMRIKNDYKLMSD